MSYRLLIGDNRETLRTLPEQSVHCCVSSPPYFGLRSYLPKDHPDKPLEIGSEETPEQYLETMVAVYREVRRALRDDGVCWVNVGDSYGASGGERSYGSSDGETGRGPAAKRTGKGNEKNLLGIPWRLALALQADGWCLRCDVVWAKPSPMPESVDGVRWERCRVKVAKCVRSVDRYGLVEYGIDSDLGSKGGATWADCPGCPKCDPTGGYVLRRGAWRPTRAHEFIFQLTKGERYFCDATAVAEEAVGGQPGNVTHKGATEYRNGDRKMRRAGGLAEMVAAETRNPRSVWRISAEPTKIKHFAAYPTKLVLPCVKSSTSSAGCCPHCGACWAPVVHRERIATRPGTDTKTDGEDADTIGNRDPERHIARKTVSGYRPTCRCPDHQPIPCTVLDPFAGTGTTLLVAERLELNSIGCELNDEYAAAARERIERERHIVPQVKTKRKRAAVEFLPLFD